MLYATITPKYGHTYYSRILRQKTNAKAKIYIDIDIYLKSKQNTLLITTAHQPSSPTSIGYEDMVKLHFGTENGAESERSANNSRGVGMQ